MHPRVLTPALIVLAIVLSALASCGQGASVRSYADLTKLFDYNQNQPLDLNSADYPFPVTGGVIVKNVSFASPTTGLRVMGFLVRPASAGQCAGVVFYPWQSGSRYEFLEEATALAKKGVVSLSLSVPWEYNKSWPQGDALYIQTVLDIRRAADLLVSFAPDVDANRLAFVGHGYGATWGSIVAGVDKRFKAYALLGGHPSIADCKTCLPAPLPQVSNRNLNGINYIGHAAPATLLFQFQEADKTLTKDLAQRFYEAASLPKLIKWYTTGLMDPQATTERDDWLAQQLELATPSR